jgi:hypothetical protein
MVVGGDGRDDPPPGVGAVTVATLFQGPSHFTRLRGRLIAMALEMLRGAQNIELRDLHDQTVIEFRW